MMFRKAVSPLISVILVLVFTVSISTAILGWVTTYTKTTTDAVTESSTGTKGITYCANSNVEISNVALRNVQVTSNTSVSSGETNYFDVTSISGTPTITFTGVSSGGSVDDLVGWWHFDNNVLDSSGNGNNGVLNGATYNASGKFSSAALQFDGDDFVTVAYDASLDMTDAITLAAWVSPSYSSPYAGWAYKRPVYIQDTRDAWWNKSWTKRRLITINKSMVNGTQTEFPMMVHINQLINVNENGTDVRITDVNGTQLPREIEWYNQSTGNLTVWFAGNISNETDTTFYMYYGNPSATEPDAGSTYGSEAVWDGNYKAVYLMNNDPSSSDLLDSTSNDYDGSMFGSMTSDDLINSDYGKATEFDGADDYFNLGLAVSEYFKKGNTHTVISSISTTLSINSAVITSTDWSSPYIGYQFAILSTGLIQTEMGGTSGSSTTLQRKTTTSATVNDGSYHIIADSFDGVDAAGDIIYIDGAKPDVTTNYDNLDVAASITNTQIGARDGANMPYTGIIGFLSISDIVRSDSYILTTANNLKNPTTTGTAPFYASFGAEDTYLTDYQVKIDSINTSELYDAGKIQQYCNDTRFTWLNQTSGVEQAIDFWTENCSTTNGANSTFWVEVPEIYAGLTNNTVWMYYGEAEASSASNGTNTFEFFDDFEDESYTDKWIVYTGTWSESDGKITTTDISAIIKTKKSFDASIIVENIDFSFNDPDLNSAVRFELPNNGNSLNDIYRYRDNGLSYSFRLLTYLGGVNKIDTHFDADEIPQNEIRSYKYILNDDTKNLIIYENNIKKVDYVNNNIYSGNYPISIGTNSVNNNFKADNIRVRKYAPAEPTVLSFGAEIPLGISKGSAYAINANATHAFARINNKTISSAISLGWNYIALTYNRTAGGTDEMKLYVNDVVSATTDYSTPINTNNDDFVIGNSFMGTIDEVRIYNKTLTADEIVDTFDTATLSTTTTNPRASINGNPTVNYSGTLNSGQTATLTINSDNFTIGQNNITIYTDVGVVDYEISMNGLSAVISNTGMNEVTVKQVVAFKADGSNCIFSNSNNTFDVGDVFSVSGCPMSCNEFLSIKAYTDCTGVFGEYSRRPNGC